MVAPPTVHISHCLIGRGVLLLGMRPLLMNIRGEREMGEGEKAAQRTGPGPASSQWFL